MSRQQELLGRLVVAGLLAFHFLGAQPVAAQDWPNWRGPTWNGASEVRALPVDFSREKHVRWMAELPGPGAGSPIVVGERVFINAADEVKKELLALAFARADGTLLWQRSIGSGYTPAGSSDPTRLDYRANYAAPSPVSDGQRVYYFFGNGDLVALDFAGEELWRRNIQEDYGDFAFQWSFSASPTVWEGRLFLPILQRDEAVGERGKAKSRSFLLALDAATGKTLFEHDRPTEARMESRESYATITPYVGKTGRNELLVIGGDVISGHDPASGKELWRWGTWNEGHREEWWRVVPSVVTGGGVALACAPKNAPVFAVRLDGEGLLPAEALAWKSEGRPNPITTDVPTPLYYLGRFYILSDLREMLSSVDPTTGDIHWSIELPGEHLWRASPTGADGRIWCQNHHGDLVAVDATSGEILANVALGEEDDDGICSTVAAAHGALFVRTNKKLYCIARAEPK